eukprot:SAG11_NODE_2655_length_3123_cov_1.476852_2_plen_190_part_00
MSTHGRALDGNGQAVWTLVFIGSQAALIYTSRRIPNTRRMHVRRSFIRGECIRYVKRSSCETYYVRSQARFRDALLARGYDDAEIRKTFDRVDYAKQWQWLRLRDAERRATRTAATANTPTPVTLALTLTNSQRMRAMNAVDCFEKTHTYRKRSAGQTIVLPCGRGQKSDPDSWSTATRGTRRLRRYSS